MQPKYNDASEKCFGTNGKLDIDDEFALNEELQPISANTFYNDVTNYGDYNNYVAAYLAQQSYYEDLFIQMTTLWQGKGFPLFFKCRIYRVCWNVRLYSTIPAYIKQTKTWATAI